MPITKQSHFNTKTKGFTLIELLVAIGIIAVLSSVVYASFSQARKSARDDERMANLKSLQLAVEMYKAQYGLYPEGCNGLDTWSGNLGTQWQCDSSTAPYDTYSGSNNFIIGLAPQFTESLPMEPFVGNSKGYRYYVNTARTGYKIMAHGAAETKTIKGYDDEFARCPAPLGTTACPSPDPTTTHYAVYNSVGKNW
jgi:prepilin-type N-terminal cleavage/methylation domain-containing protein